MTIRCAACGRTINVPPDKANITNLRVKCPCGNVFALADAPRVESAPGPGATAPPRPAAPAAAPRPAAAAPPPVAVAKPVPQAVPPAPRPASAAAPPAAGAKPFPPLAAPQQPATATRPAVAAPTGKATAPAVATSVTAAAVPVPTPAPAPVSWRRCVNHPQLRSEAMCPNCKVGYCSACGQRVQRAVICPACDGLCIKSEQYEQDLTRDAQRSRNMFEDLGTILAYPLRDPLSYVLLALFTWVFTVAARFALYGGLIALLLSQGVLMWYSFTALARVSNGNLRDSMPEFRDIWDIVRAFLLGICASVVSSGPLLLVVFLVPGVAILSQMNRAEVPVAVAVAHAQPPDEQPAEPPASASPDDQGVEPEAAPDAESEAPAGEPSGAGQPGAGGLSPGGAVGLAGAALGFLALAGLALLWKILYEPIALTVAGLSQSYGKTLNPLIGLDTILKMGGVYWQAWLIYCVLSAVQWGIGLLASFIPILGGLVMSFVKAYAYLAIGCLMGLAVFKKARELNWD